MIKYKFNDGGRKAAGRKGTTGDCVVRALCIAGDLPYLETYKYIAALNEPRFGRKTVSKGVYNKEIGIAMKRYGFEKVKLPKGPRPTFSQAYKQYGNCIVSTTKHVAALKDGALQDIHDWRTYEWDFETCQRKAMSIWVKK